MKHTALTTLSLGSLLTMLLTGCGGDATNPYNDGTSGGITPAVTCASEGLPVLTGVQTGDVNIASNAVYGIDGEVTFPAGTTLTIGSGAKIVGCTGQSYIAIDQGAQIEAIGTSVDPIVMTSIQDHAGLNNGTEQGEWGGLAIFGYAEGNKGLETYEAGDHLFSCDLGGVFPASQGGTVLCNDADNSGTLKYVIIKHSGFEVETDKELNGLSLGGIGSGTTIDNVAVIGSLDDGIEVWGGKVNMTNLYIFNNADDSLDWDHGWTGSATNVYVEQRNVDGTGSRGFETDNNGGSTTKELTQPISNPAIDKFTIITADAGGQGIVHREGTAGQLSNGIIITNNAGKGNIEVRSATTVTNGLAYSGAMVLSHAASIHYKGSLENLNDSIFGDVTDEEVEDIVSDADAVGAHVGATVTLDSSGTDLATLQAATPTAGNQADFSWVWAP